MTVSKISVFNKETKKRGCWSLIIWMMHLIPDIYIAIYLCDYVVPDRPSCMYSLRMCRGMWVQPFFTYSLKDSSKGCVI